MRIEQQPVKTPKRFMPKQQQHCASAGPKVVQQRQQMSLQDVPQYSLSLDQHPHLPVVPASSKGDDGPPVIDIALGAVALHLVFAPSPREKTKSETSSDKISFETLSRLE